jgi:hypothetical protein
VAKELETTIRKLSHLLEDIRRGAIRIPRMQRSFVWTTRQMLQLFDSIRLQFPIGGLLFWEVDRDYGNAERIGPVVLPQAPVRQGEKVLYLLDGQQRMSTLFGVLFAPEAAESAFRGWRFFYDPLGDAFIEGSRVRGEPAHHLVPMRLLVESFALLTFLDQRKSALSPDQARQMVDNALRTSSLFRDYGVPVMTLKHAQLDEAVRVFVRVNKQGTPLSTDDLVAALAYGLGEARPYDYREKIKEILDQRLKPHGFGELGRLALLRALIAALPGEDNIFEADLQGLMQRHADKIPEVVEAVGEAAGSAAQWLRANLGVASAKALPYALQFVLLTEVFRNLGPDGVPSPALDEKLKRWLWSTSVTSAYAVGNSRRFNDVLHVARRLTRSHETDIPDLRIPALPFPRKYHPRSARVRGFLLMLKMHKPRNLTTGEELPWDPLLERAWGDTVALIPSEDRWRLANRILVGRSLKGEPRAALEALERRDSAALHHVLASHGITLECWGAWKEGRYADALALRELELMSIEREMFERFGITPPPESEPYNEEDPLDAEDDPGEGDDDVV